MNHSTICTSLTRKILRIGLEHQVHKEPSTWNEEALVTHGVSMGIVKTWVNLTESMISGPLEPP